MADVPSIDVAELIGKQLETASPDLLPGEFWEEGLG